MDIKGLLINVVNTRLDANFEARRPAVQAAKDRKAIVKQEMAQLKKDQAALDKKIKKQRNKQAEKIYKMRQAGDYEGSIAAIEEKVTAKAEQVKKEAIAFVEKENAAK